VNILNGPQLQERILKIASSATAMDFAVAFWGAGSIEALGLSEIRKARIICNLTMGGTSPKVIRELIDIGFEVRHLDTLHSKIYLFDDVAFVGSSNASANGLSLQGKVLSGWHETNVELSDASQIAFLKENFDYIWNNSRPASDDDLTLAEKLFNSRRRLIQRVSDLNNIDLYDNFNSLEENPWQELGIYVCVYNNDLSDAAQKVVADARVSEPDGKGLDGFEDWDDIAGKIVVCFKVTKQSVRYDGIWEVHEKPYSRSPKVDLANRLPSGVIPHFDEAKLRLWKPAVLRAFEFNKTTNRQKCFLIEIEDFFKKFVRPSHI
jgi:hypothetical protein